MCVVAGLAVLTVAAQAFIFDGQISIDRALNSPTLTIRYSNASAALVELRVNGESVATRTVNEGKSSGETTFTLNMASLNGGDNKVEIRLFDKGGKLLATETTTVTTESTQGPVFLSNPKMGATIKGNIDLKVGFGREMKNSYVSFFIDNQFKSISNVPPFEFTWDTTRDTNGWHEVEAWVVDDTSATFKTRKVRVFVQNPGGQTSRPVTPDVNPPIANPPAKTPVKEPIKAPAANLTLTLPLVSLIHPTISGPLSTKPASFQPSVATGFKEMTPTGKRNGLPAKNTQANHLPPINTLRNPVTAANTGMISITRGQRLPNVGTFAVVYNTQFVNFDVQPRVENGVPLTPFRHLIEKAGGKVDWANKQKNVSAQAEGKDIFFHIGDAFALINKQRFELERATFIDSGRTIVPLSFMKDALNVNIDYDKATGHVLITNAKK